MPFTQDKARSEIPLEELLSVLKQNPWKSTKDYFVVVVTSRKASLTPFFIFFYFYMAGIRPGGEKYIFIFSFC